MKIIQVFFKLKLGVFQKAIMQSGSIFNPWAFNEKHSINAAFELAKNLGCEKQNPKEIVQYLQNVPANDLVKCSKSKFKFSVSITVNKQIYSN